MNRSTLLCAAFAAALLAPAARAAELLMAEAPGCLWCARWEREIGGAWPLTPEGRRAPLRRFALSDPPENVRFAAPLRVTPTFVLVEGGAEVGRIEGHPGDQFFWPMIDALLRRLPPETGGGS